MQWPDQDHRFKPRYPAGLLEMVLTETDTMTPHLQRLAFPLRAPRQLTLAWLPWHVVAAAIDGYHAAFFAVLDRRPL